MSLLYLVSHFRVACKKYIYTIHRIATRRSLDALFEKVFYHVIVGIVGRGFLRS